MEVQKNFVQLSSTVSNTTRLITPTASESLAAKIAKLTQQQDGFLTPQRGQY
jgi:hypothetical protein